MRFYYQVRAVEKRNTLRPVLGYIMMRMTGVRRIGFVLVGVPIALLYLGGGGRVIDRRGSIIVGYR
jgi:hypothetical protein